ncbi:hypothetical protein DRE_04323 [Drechslerella stenobrocha 248]|uniref:Uncharacterized protein n=1 Tax=Drechslerella stenobrocha 248 TaxID=1043628 RepID=W7IBA4_9PEZI|nr:hypothetical protein DRE_04323 [Drechslerella stenobrocha 248]
MCVQTITHSALASVNRILKCLVGLAMWSALLGALAVGVAQTTFISSASARLFSFGNAELEVLLKGIAAEWLSLGMMIGLITCAVLLKWLEVVVNWAATDVFQLKEELSRASESSMSPIFFLSDTGHLRLSPNKFYFHYPILYVGFSAKFTGSIGSFFSVKPSADEVESDPRRWWFTFFSVDPANFMSKRHGFEEKVRRFLRLQGVDDAGYPHIYVVTAPSFIRWAFNPVTYYYVYDEAFELAYTILEVSSTFHESHAYLLPRSGPGVVSTRDNYLYSCRFEKNFHISPFNKRAGAYKVDIVDPVQERRFDIKVTLLNEEGKRRMVVHTRSMEEPLEMLDAKWKDVIRMVLGWALCGFMVVLRTLWQCGRIFRMSNTEINERPEPLTTSKARAPSGAELKSQRVFLQYLQKCIDAYSVPVRVKIRLPRADIGDLPPSYDLVQRADGTAVDVDIAFLDVDIDVRSHAFWYNILSRTSFLELHESELALQPAMRSVNVSDWELLIDILNTQPELSGKNATSELSGLCSAWTKAVFSFHSLLFRRLHGGALEASPIYLYYKQRIPTDFVPPSSLGHFPVQDFAAYCSTIAAVVIVMLKAASFRLVLRIVKCLGWNLEWLPKQ